MQIASVRHKGLRRLFAKGDASGLPAPYADKIRKMIAYLQDAGGISELKTIPAWHAHILTGVWALHVSPNWRLTCSVDARTDEIIDLDLEDYH